MNFVVCQGVKYQDFKKGEILQDTNENGKYFDWAKYKRDNMYLAGLYNELSNNYIDKYNGQKLKYRCRHYAKKQAYYFKRFLRVSDCGRVLVFKRCGDCLKLYKGNFCLNRLCPTCNKRRSLKLQYQNFKTWDYIDTNFNSNGDYSYLFLTLTIPNMFGEGLKNGINLLLSGWDNLRRQRFFKKYFVGWSRSLEITHNLKQFLKIKTPSGDYKYIKNPYYNSFHPHLHCILVAKKEYFLPGNYKLLKKDVFVKTVPAQRGKPEHDIYNLSWLSEWKNATGLNTITAIDIRRVYNNNKNNLKAVSEDMERTIRQSSAVCEVSKYPVKSNDYITCNRNIDLYTVKILDSALFRVRFNAWGGIVKKARHDLLLSDSDNDNQLENITDDEDVTTSSGDFIFYFWRSGYNRYTT